MGVLKVNVGDAVTPDWRNSGCGGGASPGLLKLWDGTQWVRERCDNDTTLVFADNFNRANGTLTSPWTLPTGTVAVQSNAAQITAVDTSVPGASCGWAVVHATADCTLSLTFTGSSGNTGLVFRFQDLNNCWVTDQHARIYRRQGGLFTVLCASPKTLAAGDVLTVNLSGSTIRAYMNGTLYATITSSIHAAEDEHGMWGLLGERYDDFSITAETPGHPLNVWDGSAWVQVACMVPA